MYVPSDLSAGSGFGDFYRFLRKKHSYVITMADHAVDDDFDGDIFIYRGGRAPQHITHALIDTSVDEIEDMAFHNCRQLLRVDTHDGLRKIGKKAFCRCVSLRRINLKSVVEIDQRAFFYCRNLEMIEFGDRLETIGESAFSKCALRHLNLPSIITIGSYAFSCCELVTDLEFSERLQRIGADAFQFCFPLRRIAIPLKRDLFEYSDNDEKYNQFDECYRLITVDLVGGIHKTVASLYMESWRVEMFTKINRINQVLPNTPVADKTNSIQQWMETVLDKMEHYKAEHVRYVKEGISLLELALWKAKLLDETDKKEDSSIERQRKKAKVDSEVARKDRRITCGADIVIKNVLPFLQLE